VEPVTPRRDDSVDRLRAAFLLADEARALGLVVTRLQPGPFEGTYVVQLWTPAGAVLADDETVTGPRLLELFRLRARQLAAGQARQRPAASSPVGSRAKLLRLRRPAGRATAEFDAWLRLNGVEPGDVRPGAVVEVDGRLGSLSYESVEGTRHGAVMRLGPPGELVDWASVPDGDLDGVLAGGAVS
jgi:hypothetical protein